MASLLRQIVAGPRARHPEAGLDLCYVTDFIIATSGPSQTYPELAYRNPLDQLIAFLDLKHGEDWAIWEFRAEGTGYPDEAVYNRIWHYPWPDHHPPPFRLVPMIMASMRNWLHGDDKKANPKPADASTKKIQRDEKRVVVVHCKAGKGRSGTASCSYLISEEGWTAENALRQFTERRMRPQFGAGVSIPSQLRWVGYVDRWTRGGKKYLDRRIEIVEIRIWGLRNGVKVDVEGFADEGKRIEVVHTFSKEERVVEVAGAPEGGGISAMMWDLAGYPEEKILGRAQISEATNKDEMKGLDKDKKDKEKKQKGKEKEKHDSDSDKPGTPTVTDESITAALWRKGISFMDKVSPQGEHAKVDRLRAMMAQEQSDEKPRSEVSDESEPGGMTVLFKPAEPVILANSDINVSVERRNRSSRSMGLTMVTAVAHAWFNAYFEGNGPEQGGRPDDSGHFTMDWEAMDGIKGSSRKGTRALDRLSVIWRVADGGAQPGQEIVEPEEGEFVPQAEPADWHGVDAAATAAAAYIGGGAGPAAGTGRIQVAPEDERDLGLRVQSPLSAGVSRASSAHSAEQTLAGPAGADEQVMEGLKTSGPSGGELDEVD